MSKRVTVKEFALQHKDEEGNPIGHVTANAVLVFLRTKGFAKLVDKIHKKNAEGVETKGKAANIYELPDECTIKL